MRTCLSILLMCGMVAGCSPAQSRDLPLQKQAPDFTLPDINGKRHSLSDYHGKYVVLEWINHGCPFVQKHYNSGNMQNLQRTLTDDGVVWLSICSSAPGKQGHLTPGEWKEITKEKEPASTAILLDPKGKVGRAYGAKTTPHMYVINPEGLLVYRGAIDDRPTFDVEDVQGAKNYVLAALAEAKAGQQISTPATKPYGCSVKYK